MSAMRNIRRRLGVMTEQLAHAPVLTVKQVKLSESFARPCWGQSLLARTTWAKTSTAAVGNSDHSSYVHGAYEQTLLGQTIGDNLRVMAESLPDNLAIASLHQQTHTSYAELHAAVAVVARGLLGLGIGPGDRVAMYSPNNTEWITTMYATASIGAILVPLNPSYKSQELAHALLHSKAKIIITATKSKGVDMLQTVHAALQQVVAAGSDQVLEHLVTLQQAASGGGQQSSVQSHQSTPGIQHLHWTDIIAASADASCARLAEVSSRVQFDDAAQIQYTSGTTGRPKGVMLSHHSLLNNGFFIGKGNKYTPQDRVCLPVPLFHCFGCVLGAMAITTHGASMIFPGEGFDAGQTLRAVEQEQCTALYGVPTMFIAELAQPDFASFDLRSLKKGIMAGSPCPQEVMQKVIHQMHMTDITICYGMTETSPVSFQSSPEDSVQQRVATIGRVHPHVEAKVVDPATGRILPRGQTGELCTRGYSVMLGYWDDAAATAKVIDKARWMHTGDLAVLDADGYCRIVGRLKDVIIRGGENISPREIEEVIHQHASVMDVQRVPAGSPATCVSNCFLAGKVIGVPDGTYGEEVCAWVRLHPKCEASAQELQQWCKENVAAFKIPRYWQFVDSYPLTASGKVQKYLMRQSNLSHATDCGKLYDRPKSGQVSFY